MVSADVKYWFNCIDTYSLSDKFRERPILIWGAYSKAGSLCEELEHRNLPVAGYIDGHKDIPEYMGKPVYKPKDVLPGKGYYILVALERNERRN